MITEQHLIGGMVGLLLGFAAAFGALYKYMETKISPEEAREIYRELLRAKSHGAYRCIGSLLKVLDGRKFP